MRIANAWGKFELYIISLWLLFVLIIIITIDVPLCQTQACEFIGFEDLLKRNIVPSVALIFLLLGIFFYFRFSYRLSGSKSLPSKILRIEDANYEHLTFLTTYIIPLISFDLTSTRYLLVLTIFLIVIGIMYAKTDKFYANPTLALLGFRLYNAALKTKVGDKEGVVIITKDRLAAFDQIKTLDLDNRMVFGRKV